MTDQIPFANGTERRAWEALWCDHCARDHSGHGPNPGSAGCGILCAVIVDGTRHPDAWTPEPPALGPRLPALILCDQFTPCHLGDCTGDRHAETRVEITARVKAAWDDERRAVAR